MLPNSTNDWTMLKVVKGSENKDYFVMVSFHTYQSNMSPQPL